MTNDEVVHIVSTPQHLLGRFADALAFVGIDMDTPRALCGVSLVDRAEPPTPEPGPDVPTCPKCRAKNIRITADGVLTASELGAASIQAHIADREADAAPSTDAHAELPAKRRTEVDDAWWEEVTSGGPDSTWCIHLHGPDDILPAASRRDAILRANQMNTAMVRDHLGLFDEEGMAPAMWAVPAMRKDVS
jgi:hypothetical protein